MKMAANESEQLRVLVMAPIGRDAAASAELLAKSGILAEVASDLTALVIGLEDDAGAVLITEEAVFNADTSGLETWVTNQPAWSDLPFIILTSHLDHPKIKHWRQHLNEKLHNVALLERPLQSINLTSAIEAALRARRRQFEVKALIEARDRTAIELEALVEARTRELQSSNAELMAQMAERERIEASLRQSQKMEAVGQLTGGLAHDFNNLLAAISGSIELTKSRLAQGKVEAVDRYMTAAQSAVKRAAALTHRLLAFSRRQTLDPKPTNINRLVTDMEELIRRTVGPAIHTEVVGAAGLWPTLVDQNQLENALLNLCINARDAMPEGGRLTVETANKWLDDRAAKERELAPGQYISLCVTDTGTGMTPELISKIFDPFFTTKPLGEGTGLGLSMIYGFARQSGGQIRVYSEVGKGTTMCLYLPRHNVDAEAEAYIDPTQAIEPSGDGEVVMVIDDEPTIRLLIAEVLGDGGYSAIEASDGPAGMRVLQSAAKIDLLITDVGLPGGMNGRQVADAARVLRPNLKVLFVTGYAENAVVGNGQLEKGMQIIAKPFAMDVLAKKIREMMEG
jgi:signal transduction histidine kinase/ActR/RegA family two-component response regulator